MPEAPQELDPKPDVPPPRRISRRDLLKIGIGAAAGIGALGALARLGDRESTVAPRPVSVEKTGKSPMEGIGRAQQTNGRSENTVEKPIPVILDTDIGYDIDDTWALAMLLRSPELDLKLAVSDTQHTGYAASIIAKMLEAAGRTDVPVGVGVQQHTETGGQLAWVADYELGSYPGTVAEDGVGAIIETIMEAAEPVTLICV
ncbi:MAG TPA: nucleoside hydrolase, partial [Anaerolineae bacterium]|nr:nucleoside hydrolase [Anaerolineae bacterium]